MSFGERLRSLRKACGLTQRDLAAHCDLDHTYISKMEHDALEFLPSEATIRRMAEMLQANPMELLNLAGKVPTSFKGMLEANTPVAEVLRLLGEHSYSDDVYLRLLMILRDASSCEPHQQVSGAGSADSAGNESR